jgi:hypothetical protein
MLGCIGNNILIFLFLFFTFTYLFNFQVLVPNTLSEIKCKRLQLCPHAFTSENIECISVKCHLKLHVMCVEEMGMTTKFSQKT